MTLKLPIDPIRPALLSALERGPVVVCAPTGSGKSTQAPRWCASADEGAKVLVVEPRRVACRSLAQRVAELEGVSLGQEVGYSVRDDHRASERTRILFATTGVVVRMLSSGDARRRLPFSTVILDEFHERSLDVDLLLALFRERLEAQLLVMSATLDGVAVAEHLAGELIEAQGRAFPVDRRYLPGQAMLPEIEGLESRLAAALAATEGQRGDVLVFLPGKGEIASAASALAGRSDLEVLPLHGGLSLREQSRAFEPAQAGRRKVVLATNVAETSITLPGVTVVIDSGLVRRTRYHNGRGFLTLVPIARDSAEQRAGRAGRTAPGLCYRLWNEQALLEARTPPAVHREALAPLVLAASACGADARELPFLDPPKEYAFDAAWEELCALGAIERAGTITERGRQLFRLPVDAPLGRLLVEAEVAGCLPDAVDLVAVLSVGRPLFLGSRKPEDDLEDDPRAAGCDATASILVLRGARHRPGIVSSHVLREARQIAKRLRGAFGLPPRSDVDERVDTRLLARTAIAADPRCAYVARRRRGKVAWSNGGTEVVLARESAVEASPTGGKPVEAIAVLESRALAKGPRGAKVIVTCATPLHLSWLVEAGLGTERAREPSLRSGRLIAQVERVYAKRLLDVREEVPTGALAREAVAELFLRGSILKGTPKEAADRLEAWALLRRLTARGRASAEDWALWTDGLELPDEGLELGGWVLRRLEELELESGDDLPLLSEADLLPPELSASATEWLDRLFPRKLHLGEVTYRVTYDLTKSEVTLHAEGGGKRRPPPPLSYLPVFTGFRILVRDRNTTRVLRD